MSEYTLRFDFDCEDEPPKVYIHGPSGCAEVEVIEEPLFRGKPFVEGEGFSWNADDWSPGPLAVRLLAFLNGQSK